MRAKSSNRKVNVRERLGWYFQRNGYVRSQNLDRLESEGYRKYKKGAEVRLVAESRVELREIKRLLQKAGFEPGTPYRQGGQIRIPIYGMDQVERFLEYVEADGTKS